MSIKKKYESLLGKRASTSKSKYVVKTEEDAPPNSLASKKRMVVATEQMAGTTYERKKKSFSGYERKRQS